MKDDTNVTMLLLTNLVFPTFTPSCTLCIANKVVLLNFKYVHSLAMCTQLHGRKYLTIGFPQLEGGDEVGM